MLTPKRHIRRSFTGGAIVLTLLFALAACSPLSPPGREPPSASAESATTRSDNVTGGQSSGGIVGKIPKVDGAADALAASGTVAVLLAGPEPGRGLPFVRGNISPYWKGTYSLSTGNGVVFFTYDQITPEASWTQVPCGSATLRKLPLSAATAAAVGLATTAASAGTTVTPAKSGQAARVTISYSLYFYDGNGYTVFELIPEGDSGACTFSTPFLSRLSFFFQALVRDNAYGPDSQVPFPAIVR